MRNAIAVAIAGGAVSVALIEFLTKTGVLTRDDAREILTDAKTRLGPFMTITTPTGVDINNGNAIEASRIIGDLYNAVAQNLAD
jgi:hypothetical protein